MAFFSKSMGAEKVDGIYYNLNKNDYTATVVAGSNKYQGDIIIPPTFEFGGNTYTVTSIGIRAFYDCKSLTTIDIPVGVTSIGEEAFRDCTSLESINLPDGLTSIGEEAFAYCSSLESIDIPNGVTSFDGSRTFYKCTNLTSVHLPDGMKIISNSAFEECSSLTSINFPEGLTTIESSAFYKCGLLTSINFPEGLTTIGSSAFYNCGLTTVTLPNSVNSIGSTAFANCVNLTSINIPKDVTRIESQTFMYCYNLDSVTLPDGLAEIQYAAFKGCISLSSIIIPNSVFSIGHEAFSGCSSLSYLTIGSGVTKIDYYAFQNCKNLTCVICYATKIPNNNGSIFDGVTTSKIPLIVPDESINLYLTTSPWKSFNPILRLSSALVVTANSYTREYGEPNPTFEFTEGITMDGTPSITCLADENSPAGTYPIIVSQGTLPYSGITFINGTLTITKAPLTITADSYTVNMGDAMPTFGAIYEGFKNNDDETILTTAPSFSCATTNTYTEGEYDIIVSGAESDRYDISYAKGLLTVIYTEIPSEVSITISSAGSSTYCSPYGLDFSGITDFKAHIATGYNKSTGNVIVQPVNDAPAFTGLYIKGKPGTYTVPTVKSDSYYVNMLVGTVVPTTISPIDGNYTNFILYNGYNGVGFYPFNNDYTVGANKAYLQIPTTMVGSSGSANFLGIEFEEGLTGVDDFTSNDSEKFQNWYSLDGRKLQGKPTQKGVYVVNGHKIVIK